jgi:hypothetical protein
MYLSLEGLGPEIETFLGPDMATSKTSAVWEVCFLGPNGTLFARSYFRAQKSLDFQAHPLPMPLVMDLARLKTISVRTAPL